MLSAVAFVSGDVGSFVTAPTFSMVDGSISAAYVTRDPAGSLRP